ncbi:metalloendopeptidase [Malassezia sp. CBS 17886]|nr:metalloendopeptidase [Malassezia sp. CBS 17886]
MPPDGRAPRRSKRQRPAWPPRPPTQTERFQQLLLDRMGQRGAVPPPWPPRYLPPGSARPGAERQQTARDTARDDAVQPRVVLVFVLAGGAGVYYVCHLEQVPATGRYRFLDVGLQEELRMGQQAYQETLQSYHGRILPASAPASAQVRRVATRIIGACAQLDRDRAPGAPETRWSVHVINDATQKNAFVLPGGHIFVFTGILPVCRGDAGLATVLSHEIAHQLARHSAEKMSGYKVLLMGCTLLDIVGIDFGLSRVVLNMLLSLPNSRAIETEADKLGLRIMAAACYPPQEAIHFWFVRTRTLLTRRKRMDSGDGHAGQWAESAHALLSTHPVNSQRISQIEHWSVYQTNGCATGGGAGGMSLDTAAGRFWGPARVSGMPTEGRPSTDRTPGTDTRS